jgi:hypothetical protein
LRPIPLVQGDGAVQFRHLLLKVCDRGNAIAGLDGDLDRAILNLAFEDVDGWHAHCHQHESQVGQVISAIVVEIAFEILQTVASCLVAANGSICNGALGTKTAVLRIAEVEDEG